MTKITVFVRGILNNNKTQLQLGLNGVLGKETESNLTFTLNNDKKFTLQTTKGLLTLYDGTSKTLFKNFWFFIGTRDENDKFYTKTWTGGNADGCRLATWRDL